MALIRGPHAAPAIAALAALALFFVPAAHLPAFYESFFYILCYWIALATSWNILSGYAHYLSFGHGAFFGAGVYASATLTTKFSVPFLWSIPAAAAVAALLAAAIGAVVFRLNRLRGDLFALLTLAVAFVLSTIVLNTPIDGGPGVYLSAVPLPDIAGSPTATIYVLGLGLAVISIGTAYAVAHSRLGLGLFAIHDDEDVAEAKGVPTFRYKMIAFAISAGIAGAVGAVHAMYVSYVTVGETFGITVPVYVVLMSVLGGMRHWLGPAVGAALIGASLFAFTGGASATIGRAVVAFGLIAVILLLPEGVVPTLLRRARGWLKKRAKPAAMPQVAPPAALRSRSPVSQAGAPLLACFGVEKSFGGLRALRGVSLEVKRGEILGLVGPNGSGKTTLINVISGQYRRDAGRIALDGHDIGRTSAHRIAALGIARTYQIPRPFAHLTALENVILAGTFGGQADRAAIRAEAQHWLEFAGLGARAETLPGELNLHEGKFLELARALAAHPSLLMLDEVLAGLTPSEIASAVALIRRIRDAGASILFVEHNMRAVLELSDQLVVLNYGQVIAAGAPREVVRDPEVITAYLGAAHA
ncbi:MAG TPA: branched-chain amino acid ABC transporter ATP-binding protein/permease [Alphaproteobacteria bacterium]|jgi:branched-chain amino acid transport system permease protein